MFFRDAVLVVWLPPWQNRPLRKIVESVVVLVNLHRLVLISPIAYKAMRDAENDSG